MRNKEGNYKSRAHRKKEKIKLIFQYSHFYYIIAAINFLDLIREGEGRGVEARLKNGEDEFEDKNHTQ